MTVWSVSCIEEFVRQVDLGYFPIHFCGYGAMCENAFPPDREKLLHIKLMSF
jgi:hypothetical protein